MDFSLEDFEASVVAGAWETAYQRLVALLQVIDRHNGATDGILVRYHPDALTPEESQRYVASRLAQAIGQLLLAPGFALSRAGFRQLMVLQRWISSLFAVSPTRNADHLIRLMGGVRADDPGALDVAHAHLDKISLLYTPESDLSLDAQALWARDPVVAANLLLALQSPRHMVSANAWRKREAIAAWLPAQLAQSPSSDEWPWEVIHDVWMHCSYLPGPEKHAIKRALNGHIAQALVAAGCPQWEGDDLQTGDDSDKPCLVVMLEWFHANHSVYRTHSESLRSLRAHYRLVGVGVREAVDDAAIALFDVFHFYSGAQSRAADLCELARFIRHQNPCLVYYLGVGMFPYTVMLSNVRLAPIQMVALGHAASTFSPCMDYFLVDEDFAGQPECYSERVIHLPQGVMPFAPPPYFADIEAKTLVHTGAVRVAIAAAAMKHNPDFLHALAQVAKRCGAALEFVFFPAFAKGLVFHEIRQAIQRHLPAARVHPHLSPQAYLQALSECDVFLCPFPYGNMNSIVDTAVFGMPGVCLRGSQPHAAIDAGIFARLDRPDALRVADDVEAYVAEAVDLIQGLAGTERVRRFDLASVAGLYAAGPVSLADCVQEVRERHDQVKNSPLRVLRVGRAQPGRAACDIGLAWQGVGQHEASLPYWDQALDDHPSCAEYHFHRAVSLHHLQRYEEAVEGYQAVLDRQPLHAAALCNLGLCLMDWKQPVKALRHGARRAQPPEDGLALGQAYRQQNLEPALDLLESALALDPQAPHALLNAGLALQALDRPQEALAHYAQCVRFDPHSANARFNAALVHLSLGDDAKGWAEYEWRWQATRTGVVPRHFEQPLWLGQAPLQGQRILLHAEQGLGDTIQFFRYVPWVKALGAVVICEVQPALKSLLCAHAGVDEWVSAGEPLPPFDWHCPLMSLPLALTAQAPGFPSPEGYLCAPAAKVQAWQARLGAKTRPRVGLVWRGNPGQRNDFHRSMAASTLLAHLPSGFDYVCLQKEIRPEDQDALAASPIRVVADALHDMSDTAALCAGMDVVVSVCTSVAHLAGALGRPTWVMLSHAADWRWLRQRDDSPWYNSARLFRQDERCTWSPVLNRVGAALEAWREREWEALAMH